MAIAFEWSATIMTISAEMVVPGLMGYWVDQRLGTRGLFLIIGFALGGTLATLQLMRIANKRTGPGGKQNGSQEDVGREDVGQS
jgi:F0F1-type ATP synthase assembly protein I